MLGSQTVLVPAHPIFSEPTSIPRRQLFVQKARNDERHKDNQKQNPVSAGPQQIKLAYGGTDSYAEDNGPYAELNQYLSSVPHRIPEHLT
ncbi:hypothetical protein QM312_29730 [Burkholderia cenocepacia]|uniref:hypothetical protein n=1 Tax=Burkholderia cenocepacia TaxID=95486 RepID=UPI0024B7CF9A|nr:hypothetical protein [Burkholderia cenocepacia]MDI9700126.1 hypothetical protein [Burkholderia cenocepacia]